jgi:hypothetical protein
MDLIEIKGIGKNTKTKSNFIEIECSQRFIDKIKKYFDLLVEYNDEELIVFYEKDKSHFESEQRKNIEDDNLVIFFQSYKQDDKYFYGMVPYWYIQQNYDVQPKK